MLFGHFSGLRNRKSCVPVYYCTDANSGLFYSIDHHFLRLFCLPLSVPTLSVNAHIVVGQSRPQPRGCQLRTLLRVQDLFWFNSVKWLAEYKPFTQARETGLSKTPFPRLSAKILEATFCLENNWMQLQIAFNSFAFVSRPHGKWINHHVWGIVLRSGPYLIRRSCLICLIMIIGVCTGY